MGRAEAGRDAAPRHDTQERILTGLVRRAPLDLRAYLEFLASRKEF